MFIGTISLGSMTQGHQLKGDRNFINKYSIYRDLLNAYMRFYV